MMLKIIRVSDTCDCGHILNNHMMTPALSARLPCDICYCRQFEPESIYLWIGRWTTYAMIRPIYLGFKYLIKLLGFLGGS